MRLDKLSILKALNNVPLVGRFFKRMYCKELLNAIESIEGRLNSPMIRFATNMHGLYDVLKGATMALGEDFRWFEGESIAVHTKTSGEASRMLYAILEGRPINPKDYFRIQGSDRPIPFMAWYSNLESVEDFVEDAIAVLGVYCRQNPLDEENSNSFEPNQVHWNQSLLSFIPSIHFKLMVKDLMSISRFILRSQLRYSYGEQ